MANVVDQQCHVVSDEDLKFAIDSIAADQLDMNNGPLYHYWNLMRGNYSSFLFLIHLNEFFQSLYLLKF
mgnify:CR=1 FL=1